MNITPWEIALIFLVALLIFGPKKLPELARGLGEAMREFRKATNEATQTVNDAVTDKPVATTQPIPPPTVTPVTPPTAPAAPTAETPPPSTPSHE